MLKRLEKPAGYTPRCDVWWCLRESCLGTIRPMFVKFGTSMTCSILIYEFTGYLLTSLLFFIRGLNPSMDARLGALTSWQWAAGSKQLNAEREAKPAISDQLSAISLGKGPDKRGASFSAEYWVGKGLGVVKKVLSVKCWAGERNLTRKLDGDRILSLET